MPVGESLAKYCLDLTALAREGKLDPVIGREEEMRRTIEILSRRTKNNPVLLGEPGVGKCFAAGTRLRLLSGAVKQVERFTGGEQLMGDDGLPRTVTVGSLRRGRAPLYRISPSWDGAQPFTVNGDHVLVLHNSARPYVEARTDSAAWRLTQWEVTTDNRMLQRSRDFSSEAAARARLSAALAGWEPLMWEVSVDDFLRTSRAVQSRCKLVACKAITFSNPQLPSLSRVLTLALGLPPSAAQLEYMAWWLGVWLTDGDSGRPSISQVGAPPPDPQHRHEICARLLAYSALFPKDAPVEQRPSQQYSARWPVYCFDYGVGSVAEQVLRLYGLLGNQHIPRALLCDSLAVRQRLLAGLIDGAGFYNAPSSQYEISAKQRRVMVGCKELAATLGLRNSAVAAGSCSHQQTGREYRAHRLSISGEMWDAVQHCAAAHKRCPQPGSADSVYKSEDSRCYGFTVTPQPVGDYFGFAVHGGANRRFLLEDYTVTHNVCLQPAACSPLPLHGAGRTALRLTAGVCFAVLCCAGSDGHRGGSGAAHRQRRGAGHHQGQRSHRQQPCRRRPSPACVHR